MLSGGPGRDPGESDCADSNANAALYHETSVSWGSIYACELIISSEDSMVEKTHREKGREVGRDRALDAVDIDVEE